MIHENVKEIRRNSSDLGLGVRFKSCVTVQAPAQFGTHKNDPSKYSGFVTIGTLAQFDSNPRIPHLNALKRILCYLKGTAHFKLRLGGTNADVNLISWTDSGRAGDVHTHYSIGSFTFEVAGGFILWSSKK